MQYKASRQLREKRAIGLAAAKLVRDGEVVGMTGGTTATEVVRALADRRGLTVVTNALNIAAELVCAAEHPAGRGRAATRGTRRTSWSGRPPKR